MLTAAAGIITAVTGLIVAVNQSGLFAKKQDGGGAAIQSAAPGSGKIPGGASSAVSAVANTLFVENFSAALGPRWKVLNPNPAKTAVQPDKGTLLIVTERGSITRKAATLRNQYVLELNLPDRDYEVIAKVSLQIQSTHNSASLALYKGDDDFLEVVYWGQPASETEFADGVDSDFYRIVSFAKEDAGQRTVFSSRKTADAHGRSKMPRHLLLKIARHGNEYSGYFAPFSPERPPESLDQVRWEKLGTHPWIGFDGKVSLWAKNGISSIHGKGYPREVAAEFDFVLVRPRE